MTPGARLPSARRRADFRVMRRSIVSGIGLLVVLVAGGCGPRVEREAGAPTRTRIVMQLDWFAEPEHGGFFQAEAEGWYVEAGLDVTLLPGGPNANVHRKLATGEVQFGQSESTTTIQAIAEGLPLLNVAAVFQEDPSVLMLHASNPISGFEDLDGKTVMARPEWVFLAYVQRRYGIDLTIVPQSFGLGRFVADPLFIQQGFYIAEPFFLRREGVVPKYLHPWDAGYRAYVVVVGNRDWVRSEPETTRRFLAASMRGWKAYLEGDPAAAHRAMLRLNDKATPEYLEFSRRMIIDERLVTGRDPGDRPLGAITRERFAEQLRQLEELGLVRPGALRVEDVMDDGLLSSDPGGS